jgi:parallel beta-helix repeat protein
MHFKAKQLLISMSLGLGLICGVISLLAVLSSNTGLTEAEEVFAAGVRYVTPAPIGDDAGNSCANRDRPCATVQHAVDVAAPGDEIRVATETYTGVSARSGITQMVYLSKTVTIRGSYSSDFSRWNPESYPTTLNAQGQGRVFYIAGDISPTLEGLRITGGDASGLGGSSFFIIDAGGGVCIITATAVLSGNTIFNNRATHFGSSRGWGGGVYLESSRAIIRGNTIRDNTTEDFNIGAGGNRRFGGGLFLFLSPAKLSNNTISGNLAYASGGGVYLLLSPATLNDNTIQGNRAEYYGGGVYLDNSAATLTRNLINDNTAGIYGGGGISLFFSPTELSDNTIVDNHADSWVGGGVFLDHSDVTLSDTTITSNTARYGGGGLYLDASHATLNRNTVQGNTTLYDEGGGIHLEDSQVTLVGNIIQGNNTTVYGDGGGMYLGFSDGRLINNIIADNRADGVGGGLYAEASHLHLFHTTIAHNSSADSSGMYVTNDELGYSTLSLTNTILVSQSVGITVTAGNTASLNSVLWYDNGADTGGAGVITVSNEYTGNPAFVHNKYRLTVNSAAINKGINAGVATDIDGQVRDAAPDLGADEYLPTVPTYLPVILRNG